MAYRAEKERGENDQEDHYVPGRFEIPVAAGEVKTFAVIATVEENSRATGLDPWIYWRRSGRLRKLEEQAACPDSFACSLVRAADAFIVQRRSSGKKPLSPATPGLPTGAGTP